MTRDDAIHDARRNPPYQNGNYHVRVKAKSGAEYVVYDIGEQASDGDNSRVYGFRLNPTSRKSAPYGWFYIKNVHLIPWVS